MKFKNKEEARVWAHFASMALMNPSNHASSIADVLLSQYRERQAEETPPVRETHVWIPRDEWNKTHVEAARWRKMEYLASWDAAEDTDKAGYLRAMVARAIKLIPG